MDAEVQTTLKNVQLKITQEQMILTGRRKQNVENNGQVDEYCQTKIKAEQFDIFIKQQKLEQERLEKRLNKLREKDNDEIMELAE